MKISLIIPAYNEAPFIGACLDSIIAHSNGKLHEIIVVDNASTDDTAAIAAGKPGVRVVHEARPGTGNARQTGAEAATGDILAYIDADTLMPAGWVEHVERAFADERVVFLSGPYRYRDSKRFPLWFLDGMWQIAGPIAQLLVGYVGNGGNTVVRRDALFKAGGIDRTIAFNGDDTDLARRMHSVGKTKWRNGFTIYTSARRFDEEGLRLYATYFFNYWWIVLFHRPFTKGVRYLRTQKKTE